MEIKLDTRYFDFDAPGFVTKFPEKGFRRTLYELKESLLLFFDEKKGKVET